MSQAQQVVDATNLESRRALLSAYIAELRDTGGDVNMRLEDGETLLMAAARDGFEGMVADLIEAGADVNLQTESGRYTALMETISIPVAKRLLDAGADVGLRDWRGRTAREIVMDEADERPIPEEYIDFVQQLFGQVA